MPQPTQLTAIQQNARTLRSNGDLAGARLMLERGLEVAKANLGEDHPEVLSTAHLLAGMHREAGEPAAARRVLEEAIAAGQLRYSDGEPLMLALSYTLGTVADELGNRHEARRNFGRVATAGPAVLGEDHAWVRAAQTYLGSDAGPAVPAEPSTTPSAQTGPPATPAQASPPTSAPSRPPTVQPSPPITVQPDRPAVQPDRPAVPPARPAVQPGRPAVPPAEPQFAPPPYQPPAYQAPPPTPPPTAIPPPLTAQTPQYSAYGSGTGISPAPPPSMPAPAPAPPPTRRGRGATVAATIAAAAAVLATAVAAVVLLTDQRSTDTPPVQGQESVDARSSAPRALPPEQVRLSEDAGVVTLNWTDPSDGTAPFIVAGNRSGEQQRAMGQVPPGTTRFRLNGLNPRLDYCFIVIAVYSADQLVQSERVCTQRSPQPDAESTAEG